MFDFEYVLEIALADWFFAIHRLFGLMDVPAQRMLFDFLKKSVVRVTVFSMLPYIFARKEYEINFRRNLVIKSECNVEAEHHFCADYKNGKLLKSHTINQRFSLFMNRHYPQPFKKTSGRVNMCS